jgi:hypothetical protein
VELEESKDAVEEGPVKTEESYRIQSSPRSPVESEESYDSIGSIRSGI